MFIFYWKPLTSSFQQLFLIRSDVIDHLWVTIIYCLESVYTSQSDVKFTVTETRENIILHLYINFIKLKVTHLKNVLVCKKMSKISKN